MKHYFAKPDLYIHAGGMPMPSVNCVRIPGAPAFMKGIRALFVSDVHLRAGTDDNTLLRFISLLTEQKADILLLGGDYGEGDAAQRRFFSALSPLSFPFGSFAVRGNNDIESIPETDRLYRLTKAANCRLLINETCHIVLDGGTLEIGGCDDAKRGEPDTKALFTKDAAYRILLSHFPALPECNADLILCGHTHGGQFNILGVTPYTVGFERQMKPVASKGLIETEHGKMYIGSGIGMSRLPLRIGTRPEITVLTF